MLPDLTASLPDITAGLTSTSDTLAQIAATLTAKPAAEQQTQQDLSTAITTLIALLGKARLGQIIENVNLNLPEGTSRDPYEQGIGVRRALDDVSMADYGRTDKWGQT